MTPTPTHQQDPGGRRLPWLAAILVLGTLLRLYLLGSWGIGLDEAYSANAAARGLLDLIRFIAADDFHPPLYYLMLHLWQYAGSTELWLRLPSVIFGVAGIWAVYRFASSLIDERVGLVAALILAISPLHIFHSQEARMYPLLFLLGVGSLYFFGQILHEGARRAWIGYWATTVLALYTHYGALAIIAAENLAMALLLLLRRSAPWKSWAVAQIAVATSFAPWILVFSRDVAATTPPPSPPLPFEQIAFTLSGFASHFLPPDTPVLKAALVALYLGAAVLGIATLWRSRPRAAILLGCGSLGALGIAAVIGHWVAFLSIGTSVLIPRTLIAVSAPLYVLVATTVVRSRPRVAGPLLLATLFGFNLFSYPQLYYRFARAGPWGDVARYVAATIQPDDGIVFVSGFWARAFDFYFARYQTAIPIVRYGGPDALTKVEALGDRAGRIVLILKQPHAVDPRGRVRSILLSRGSLAAVTAFPYGIQVEVYELDRPAR